MVKADANNKAVEAMDDLRHTAYAYHNAAKAEKGNNNEASVLEFFKQMDKNGDGKISFEEFKSHMKSADMEKYGSDKDFFDKLTLGGRDYLEYRDVVVLLFVVNGGRPFCDKCWYFIHGTFFTCVRCFEKERDYYFNLCTSCYDPKSHGHCHKEFVDPVTLLRLKAKRESAEQGTLIPSSNATTTTTTIDQVGQPDFNSLRKKGWRPPILTPVIIFGGRNYFWSLYLLSIIFLVQPSNSEPAHSSISSKKNEFPAKKRSKKYESRPSESDAIVLHIPHPQIKKPGVALELMQFAVGCTTVAAAVSQFCTIM